MLQNYSKYYVEEEEEFPETTGIYMNSFEGTQQNDKNIKIRYIEYIYDIFNTWQRNNQQLGLMDTTKCKEQKIKFQEEFKGLEVDLNIKINDVIFKLNIYQNKTYFCQK